MIVLQKLISICTTNLYNTLLPWLSEMVGREDGMVGCVIIETVQKNRNLKHLYARAVVSKYNFPEF